MSFIRTGHLNHCPAPNAPCICEARLYLTVGTLALIAGLVQWTAGYFASMAVVSDALHALSDATVDFLGFAIVIMARGLKNPQLLEKIGTKVIALVFAIGAIAIGLQAVTRWTEGAYVVVPLIIVLVGLFGVTIDIVRWKMLTRAKEHLGKNQRLDALIIHAVSDMIHSMMISAVGGLALLGTILPLDQELYAQGLKWVDFGLLFILTLYMLYMAKKIWSGHTHEHGHHH